MNYKVTKKLIAMAMLLISSFAIAQEIKTEQKSRFLKMFARAYFPGRTGQLLIVPREGHIITRPDPEYRYMHASPWAYDVSIPILFVGSSVKRGVFAMPAVQQDVAPTLAFAFGIKMTPSVTGRVLPILKAGFVQPKAVMVIVLDGMRRDYFDRYADALPTLTGLRKSGAWFSKAEINFLPTNTAVGHSTISTGTDPSIHGITAVSVYDRIHQSRKGV
ncbi:alkaline phosphatase family protein, partial [bacterium]|nr:alkaline phosphatase family protein [bacterium]